MNEAKSYRKEFGFTNKGEFVKFLRAKDLIQPNWSLIETRDERIISIFETIKKRLSISSDIDIGKTVSETRQTIRENNILYSLNNHGRAIEDVYYTWMQGYIAEQLFTPLIKRLLNVDDIERNGGDDLSNPDSFKRTASADLKSEQGRFLVDVQAGFTENKGYDIKYHKVKEAISNKGWTSFVFFADCVNGQYHMQNLNNLENAEFTPNPRWEGQLCYSVGTEEFESFLK